MSAAGPGELVRIDGNLTASQYVDILENACIPSVHALFGDAVSFVHDRSPIHTSWLAKNWLVHQSTLRELNWPARAPDLNPIENLWPLVARNCSIYAAENQDELWNNICKSWDEIRLTNTCETLVNSLPNRIQDIIDNGGFWTKY